MQHDDVRPEGLAHRFRARVPPPLVRAFAWRSAVVFVVVGIVLHFAVSTAVTEHFASASAFHAEFVAHAVLEPMLASDKLGASRDEAARRYVSETIQTFAIDDHVVRVIIWDEGNRIVAADDPDLVGVRVDGYLDGLDLPEDHAVHLDQRDGLLPPPPGGSPVAGPVSSVVVLDVVLDTDQVLFAEILQDPAPSIAAAARFTRLLDIGLVGGLGLLWALLLPIARRASRNLDRQARVDELTQLLNRTGLQRALDRIITRSNRERSGLAVMFIDLDGFKQINDAAGHATGDRILREVSARLQGHVRPDDVIARFAGDEFVVVLDRVTHPAAAEQIAHEVLEALRRPYAALGAWSRTISASIGVSFGLATESDLARLVHDADAAMYHVKANGGDGWRLFDDGLREAVARQRWIDRHTHGVSSRGELSLVYQPFVALSGDATGRVVAAEALLRWHHPEFGAVSPGEMIPIAERNGTIQEIGVWVLEEACRLVCELDTTLAAEQEFVLFVNVSPLQLRTDLPEQLDAVLRRTGADPRRLGLEITESAITGDDGRVVTLMERLRERGVRVAIDDFGTGYSSLARLRSLPVDLLKLDASFVHDLDDRREFVISAAVASLAQQLGMDVLAEGIETGDQLVGVRQLGFDLAQGYHLATPGTAGELRRMLAGGQREDERDVAAITA